MGVESEEVATIVASGSEAGVGGCEGSVVGSCGGRQDAVVEAILGSSVEVWLVSMGGCSVVELGLGSRRL